MSGHLFYSKLPTVRKAGSVLLVATACVAFLIAGMAGCGSSVVTDTVENNRKIDASFERAARFVEAFRQKEGRLPSEDEFTAWTSVASSYPHDSRGMEIVTDSSQGYQYFLDEVADQLGALPDGSYLLMYWRGEWMEYYAGWSSRSTIPQSRSDYYLLGSALLDIAVFTLLGVVAIYGAKRLRSPEAPRML